MGWSFDFGFGISVSDTFYIKTNEAGKGNELKLDISAFLDGDTSTQEKEKFNVNGELLFFGADLVDNRPNGKASGIYGELGLDLKGDESQSFDLQSSTFRQFERAFCRRLWFECRSEYANNSGFGGCIGNS